jgi:DNA-binding transcriptional ArsR family regulator
MSKKATKKQLILNYIVQIKKPFCAKDISAATGVAYSTVTESLLKLKKAGTIKFIQGSTSPRYFRYVSNPRVVKRVGSTGDKHVKKVNRTSFKIGHVPSIFGIPSSLLMKNKGEKVNESSSRSTS